MTDICIFIAPKLLSCRVRAQIAESLWRSCERCFPITTKLFQSGLVMIRLWFHQATKQAGDWPLRFVRGWRKLEIRELSSLRNLSPPMFARTQRPRRRRQSELRAERSSREWGDNGTVSHTLCVPVLFSLLLFIARNQISKLGLGPCVLLGPTMHVNERNARCVPWASSSSVPFEGWSMLS